MAFTIKDAVSGWLARQLAWVPVRPSPGQSPDLRANGVHVKDGAAHDRILHKLY